MPSLRPRLPAVLVAAGAAALAVSTAASAAALYPPPPAGFHETDPVASTAKTWTYDARTAQLTRNGSLGVMPGTGYTVPGNTFLFQANAQVLARASTGQGRTTVNSYPVLLGRTCRSGQAWQNCSSPSSSPDVSLGTLAENIRPDGSVVLTGTLRLTAGGADRGTLPFTVTVSPAGATLQGATQVGLSNHLVSTVPAQDSYSTELSWTGVAVTTSLGGRSFPTWADTTSELHYYGGSAGV